MKPPLSRLMWSRVANVRRPTYLLEENGARLNPTFPRRSAGKAGLRFVYRVPTGGVTISSPKTHGEIRLKLESRIVKANKTPRRDINEK